MRFRQCSGVLTERSRIQVRGRKARSVKQEVRVQRIIVKDSAQGAIDVSCLIATAIDPPAASQPAVWRLLTNRQASILEQACELIDWYRARCPICLPICCLSPMNGRSRSS